MEEIGYEVNNTQLSFDGNSEWLWNSKYLLFEL